MAMAMAVAALAAPSNAGPGVIPGGSATNEFIGDLSLGPTIGGYYGANLYLVGGPVDIQVDWYGGEAGYQNEFWWDGVQRFVHPGGDTTGSAVDGTFTVTNVSTGLLPFHFFVPTGSLTVANGSNPDNSGLGPNFFSTFYPLSSGIAHETPGGPEGGQFVWLFFDDGGAADDDNHDDMAIRLSITNGDGHFATPEPGTMLLVGSGIAALWTRRRRS